jgi:hypothetical protein
MKAKETIDFTKIEWDKVDIEKAQFFFQAAQNYNDKVIEDLVNTNNKAHTLICVMLPILSAAIGFLLTRGEGQEKTIGILSLFSLILGIGLILLLVAIMPRKFYRGNGSPEQFFREDYYKNDMFRIYTGGIAASQKYIDQNYKLLAYRSGLITAGLCLFIGSLFVTTLLSAALYFLH